MSQNQSAFEAMPPELHLNVFSCMSGPEDVLSTIRASPGALRALQVQMGREQVYAAVLQTSLAPEVFREFLAILNAPDHNTCPRVRPRYTDAEWDEDRTAVVDEWRAWEQQAGGFLRRHAHGAVYPTLSPQPNLIQFKDQTKFLVRLYFCVSRLVNFYLSYARSRAAGTMINLPPTNPAGPEQPPLTDIERLRLQRGLLRYELCCRLIGIPSIGAYGNVRVFSAVIASRPAQSRAFWEIGPLTRLLPVDEAEEVFCASEYVHDLYKRLRSSGVEDFQAAILDLSQSRDEDSRDPKERITVEDWLSSNPLKGRYHPSRWAGEFGSRLGLVFLDRVIRSSPADRTGFTRSGFHKFRLLQRDKFLRNSWSDVVYSRGFLGQQWGQGSSLQVGPQCNAILKTCTTNHAIMILLIYNEPKSLRRQGWVFFDDQSRLRSLGLPEDGEPKSIYDCIVHDYRFPRRLCSIPISEAALATRFTEDKWNELFERYCPKDLASDFQAMSRFVADARAVVDFNSNQVPQARAVVDFNSDQLPQMN